MAAVARERIAGEGWRNVTVVQSPAEDAQIPVTADAAVFCAVHDILQSPDALRNVMTKSAGGMGGRGRRKWAAPWLVGVNLQARTLHAPFARSFEGFGPGRTSSSRSRCAGNGGWRRQAGVRRPRDRRPGGGCRVAHGQKATGRAQQRARHHGIGLHFLQPPSRSALMRHPHAAGQLRLADIQPGDPAATCPRCLPTRPQSNGASRVALRTVRFVSVQREELLRLVEELPEEEVPAVLDDVRRHLRAVKDRSGPRLVRSRGGPDG